jgi:hypothetical protein
MAEIQSIHKVQVRLGRIMEANGYSWCPISTNGLSGLEEMWKDRERPTKIVSFMSLVLYPWDPFDRRLGAPPKPM